MVVLYSVVLFAGVFAVGGWLVAGTLAANPDSRVRDPAVRFGSRGRDVANALLGFGLGGMSSSYAGWPVVPTVVAAIGGAAFLVASTRLIGTDQPER